MPNLGSFGLHSRFDGQPCPRREVFRCEEPGCGWINPAVYDLAGVPEPGASPDRLDPEASLMAAEDRRSER